MEAIRQKILELLGEDQHHYPRFLEQNFPHILKRMLALWGQKQMAAYLTGLMQPPAANSKGFPNEAIAEIQRINEIHNEKYPLAMMLSLIQEEEKPSSPPPRTSHQHDTRDDIWASTVFDRAHHL